MTIKKFRFQSENHPDSKLKEFKEDWPITVVYGTCPQCKREENTLVLTESFARSDSVLHHVVCIVCSTKFKLTRNVTGTK